MNALPVEGLSSFFRVDTVGVGEAGGVRLQLGVEADALADSYRGADGGGVSDLDEKSLTSSSDPGARV